MARHRNRGRRRGALYVASPRVRGGCLLAGGGGTVSVSFSPRQEPLTESERRSLSMSAGVVRVAVPIEVAGVSGAAWFATVSLRSKFGLLAGRTLPSRFLPQIV